MSPKVLFLSFSPLPFLVLTLYQGWVFIHLILRWWSVTLGLPAFSFISSWRKRESLPHQSQENSLVFIEMGLMQVKCGVLQTSLLPVREVIQLEPALCPWSCGSFPPISWVPRQKLWELNSEARSKKKKTSSSPISMWCFTHTTFQTSHQEHEVGIVNSVV